MASALLGRRSHRLLGGALAIWVLAAITLVKPAGAQGIDTSPEPLSLARFGEVPAFTFVERSGKEISREDLLGRPWIAVPFFVGCTGPCPTVTSDLRVQLVEDEDLAASGVRIVSFSVDPEFDTPERLRAYAEQYGIGSEDPWLFLTGDPSEMEQFVVHGLKTSFVRSEEAGVEYGQSITHATRVPVIDSLGRIAGWYQVSRQALEGGSIDDALALLRSRALALASPYPLVTLNALLNGAATLLLWPGGSRSGGGAVSSMHGSWAARSWSVPHSWPAISTTTSSYRRSLDRFASTVRAQRRRPISYFWPVT